MLWLFVILGVSVFTAALFGFLLTVRARSVQSGLHFVALFLAGAAWMMGHGIAAGWTALLVAALVELAAWFKAITHEPRQIETQPAPAQALVAEPAPAPKPTRAVISIVLLRTRWQATGDVFLASLRRSGRRDARLVASGDVIRVEIGPVAIDMRSSSTPLRAEQIDYALSQAFDWPDAASRIKTHAGHITITTHTADDVTRFEIIRQHVQAQLALAEFAPITAVLWPDAGRLIQPGEVQPLLLPGADLTSACISFRTFPQEDGRVVCDTAGLCAFGLPDLQLTTDGEPGDPVATLLYDLAGELLADGCNLEDGERLSGRFKADYVIHIARSIHPPSRQVLDLRPPEPVSDQIVE
ncbi:MAG: DUF4261 domain-containing protein [Planctomycetota bacterium]|mgnify:CR=1 FL=1